MLFFDSDETYLDHSGTTIPAASLLRKHYEVLSSNVYGNPHSQSRSSQRTTAFLENAKSRVLKMFNTDSSEYDLIFTQNSTAAIKLLGEGLSDRDWSYAYSEDAHTSLVGLRQLATNYKTFSTDSFHDCTNELYNESVSKNLLVAWPGQSNFSGERFINKDWHVKAKALGDNVYTLLDIAALAMTYPIDLSSESALATDFLCLSFYKIFGFPDLGALLIKKSSKTAQLFEQRRYFGGGTVEALTINQDFFARKSSLSCGLHDGTVPFHSIIALSLALDTHYELFSSFTDISNHVTALSKYAIDRLLSLTYENGQQLVKLYSNELFYGDSTKQGPIITFNLRDSDGEWIGYSKFDEVCSIEGISIRTGTMCNTGSAAKVIGYSEKSIIENYYAGHVCGDENDVMHDTPTGAIRVSFGAMSSTREVEALIQCLQRYFLNPAALGESTTVPALVSETPAHVKSLQIFPIKSCGAFLIPENTKWRVLPEGLEWDREFCVVSTATGDVLSMKKYTEMANIRPFLDTDSGTMRIRYQRKGAPVKDIIVPLLEYTINDKEIQSRLCGERIKTAPLESEKIKAFFSDILGTPCTLAKSSTNQRFYKPHLDGPLNSSKTASKSGTETNETKKIKISMTNSSPLLLISESSMRELNKHREPGANATINSSVFRGNIIIDGGALEPYAEDEWSEIAFGNCFYTVSGIFSFAFFKSKVFNCILFFFFFRFSDLADAATW